MTYIDVDDIAQHFFQSGALEPEQIAEIMGEEEYYVKTELDMDTLPDDNPTIKKIVRDLTIASCMLVLVPVQGDPNHADYLRREALRRLQQIDRGGLGPSLPTYSDAQNEVYNPDGPTWCWEEWDVPG